MRKLSMVIAAALVALGSASWLLAGTAQAAAGYRDFSFNASSVAAPTGQKPQSKLWFANGLWWGSLFNTATDNFEMYKLNSTTQQWTTTGVVIDSRNTASADMLWDGSKLYSVSAGINTTDTTKNPQITRYSFNTTTNTYTKDAGFPVTLNTAGGMETIVLSKDSAGMLWVAYTKNSKVYTAHSTTSDSSWTNPYLINATGSNNLTADDIATVISYGSKTGIMWSNQNDQKIYFASHVTGAADTSWSTSIAVQGTKMADDHINVKADSQGNVWAVTKTSRNDVSTAVSEPIIILSKLTASTGTWTNYTVAKQGEGKVTRGIVSLDEANNKLYVFYTNDDNGGYIVYRSTALNAPSFTAAAGTPYIQNSTDLHLNNASTSKQNVTAQSGVVVVSGDDTTKFYAHNTSPAGSL